MTMYDIPLVIYSVLLLLKVTMSPKKSSRHVGILLPVSILAYVSETLFSPTPRVQ